MEIRNIYVTELSNSEKKEINGGMAMPSISKWFKSTLVGIAIGVIIDHWSDIKSGAVDGWTDACKEID